MRKKTITFLILAAFFIAMRGLPAHAYRLPPRPVSAEEMARPAEKNLAIYKDELSSLRGPARLAEYGRNTKLRLNPDEKRDVARFEELKIKIAFWERAAGLKIALLSASGAVNDAETVLEADAIAKTVIETLYKISPEYDVAGSALIQNFLIKRGIKKKGFCYHYVTDLKNALSAREWRRFDIRWGCAWGGDFRENNSLVITAKGMPFDTGLVIDAWRTAGKPFWTNVKGDRFPWVEEFGVNVDQDIKTNN